MKIGIAGSGYVGTTIAACFADLGHEVMIVDVDESVVTRLNDGEAPVAEPGLDDLLGRYAGDSLFATTEYEDLGDFGPEVLFLALSADEDEEESAGASTIEAGAEALGSVLADLDGYPTVVVKSPVVPGTTEDVIGPALELESGGRAGVDFGLAVEPEFLRIGSAVDDFTDPDRLVFGTDDDRARDALDAVYEPLLDGHDAPVVDTGLREAETIKHATDATLVTAASLVDELGSVCEAFGVDADGVIDAVGLDGRVAEGLLDGAPARGGGRYPESVRALVAAASERGSDPELLQSAVDVNDRQPQRMLDLLDEHVDVEGKRVAILGLATEPDTDDVRGSRAIPIIEGLQARGADVIAYDPEVGARNNMAEQFPDVEYLASASPTLSGAHAALIVTDWPAFGDLDREFDLMSNSVVIDGRRIIERREGITYEGLTW